KKDFGQLEDEVWTELAERVGTSVRLGDRTIALADLRAEVKRPRGLIADFNSYASIVFAGGVGRNHQGVGDKPFMEKTWGFGPIKEERTRSLVQQAMKQCEGRNQPVLPAFFPVAADDKVIYRDYWGVHARYLQTGRLAWDSDSRYSLDRLLDPREA